MLRFNQFQSKKNSMSRTRRVDEMATRKNASPRGWRVSFVVYGGMSYGPDSSEMYTRQPMPSWVKNVSDALGVCLYMVLSGFNFERVSNITQQDVINMFKECAEDNEYEGYNADEMIANFKSCQLCYEDVEGYLLAGEDDTEAGYIGYINRPNNHVMNINKDMWDDDLQAELDADEENW